MIRSSRSTSVRSAGDLPQPVTIRGPLGDQPLQFLISALARLTRRDNFADIHESADRAARGFARRVEQRRRVTINVHRVAIVEGEFQFEPADVLARLPPLFCTGRSSGAISTPFFSARKFRGASSASRFGWIAHRAGSRAAVRCRCGCRSSSGTSGSNATNTAAGTGVEHCLQLLRPLAQPPPGCVCARSHPRRRH